LAGASGFIPDSSDILLAELRAIYHGLILANNMGLTELACYTDSLTCISLIHGNPSPYHVHAVLIRSIKDILSRSTVTLCHTLRESNQCADFLAKLGASSNDNLMIHTSPPDGLLNLLHADASGTLFMRE
jgi:ribonuclease HI